MLIEVEDGSGKVIDEMLIRVKKDGILFSHLFRNTSPSSSDDGEPHGLSFQYGGREWVVPHGRDNGYVGIS